MLHGRKCKHFVPRLSERKRGASYLAHGHGLLGRDFRRLFQPVDGSLRERRQFRPFYRPWTRHVRFPATELGVTVVDSRF